MNQKHQKTGLFLVVCVWLALSLLAFFGPKESYSLSERRELAEKPDWSIREVWKGTFMEEFDAYSLDQFPFRDSFRRLKARMQYGIFQQQDNNGIYFYQDHIVKMEYPYREASVTHALKRFRYLYDRYLGDTKGALVFAVVPDKGYYAGAESGHLQMDYGRLLSALQKGMPEAEVVDLTDMLSLADYYRTDPHWKQENLFGAAKKIASALEIEPPREADYRKEELSTPFSGAYAGQAALPFPEDRITLLRNDLLDQCLVYDYETGTTGSIYERKKEKGKDPYEVYLKGARALLTITNPNAREPERELLVFRDSFGSSLVPLLLSEYHKVTLVDIRYIHPNLIGNYVEQKDRDVLFLYSTTVLNHSETLK